MEMTTKWAKKHSWKRRKTRKELQDSIGAGIWYVVHTKYMSAGDISNDINQMVLVRTSQDASRRWGLTWLQSFSTV